MLLLAGTLLVIEQGLRLADSNYPGMFLQGTGYSEHRGTPGSQSFGYALNSLGFKDEEFVDKTPGSFRIVGLGDSFTFGVVPYPHNFLTLLEQRLNQRGLNVEILNLGIPSTGPSDYFELLVNEGLDLQPDLVLVTFFIGNDFQGTREPSWHEEIILLRMLFRAFSIVTAVEPGRIYGGTADYCDDCPVFTDEAYVLLESQRSVIFNSSTGAFRSLLGPALRTLQRLDRVCRSRNVRLVVALAPDEIQVDQYLAMAVRERFFGDVSPESWDYTLPNTLLKQELEALDIPTVDLLPLLRRNPHERYYRPRDSHWNILGNRVVAEGLEQYLVNNKLVPGI